MVAVVLLGRHGRGLRRGAGDDVLAEHPGGRGAAVDEHMAQAAGLLVRRATGIRCAYSAST